MNEDQTQLEILFEYMTNGLEKIESKLTQLKNELNEMRILQKLLKEQNTDE